MLQYTAKRRALDTARKITATGYRTTTYCTYVLYTLHTYVQYNVRRGVMYNIVFYVLRCEVKHELRAKGVVTRATRGVALLHCCCTAQWCCTLLHCTTTASCDGRPLLVTAACNCRPLSVPPAEPPPASCNGRRLCYRLLSATAAALVACHPSPLCVPSELPLSGSLCCGPSLIRGPCGSC
jgi:hypothetical protein